MIVAVNRNLGNCVKKPEKFSGLQRGWSNVGSSPAEVLNFFQASLRNCINYVHCDDHFFIFNKTVSRQKL